MEDKNNSDNISDKVKPVEPGNSFAPTNSPNLGLTNGIPANPINTSNKTVNSSNSSGNNSFLSNNQTSQPSVQSNVSNPPNNIQHSAVTSNTQNTASPSVFTVKKKNKKLKLLAIVGLAVVLLGGGGVYAYYKQQTSPENLIAQSMINLVSSEKLGANMAMTMKADGVDMTIGVDMKADSKQKVGEGTISFTVNDYEMAGASLNDLTFSVNGIVKDNKAYIKIGDFQKAIDGVFDGFFAGVMASDPNAVNQLKEFATTIHQTITSDWLVFDLNEKVQGIPESCNSDVINQVSQADKDKIKSSYKSNQFVTIKEKKGSEKVKEINTEHYVIGLDAEKLNKFADSMESTESTKAVAKCVEELGGQFNIQEVSQDTDFKQEDLPQDMEIWMDKKNKTIQKVKFPLKEKETSIGDMTMEMDYQVSVNPTIPEDAITYEELMTKISQDLNSSPFIKAFLESLGLPVQGI